MRVLGCSRKHTLSSQDQVLLHCHCIPGQHDHLTSLKDQRRLDRATKSSTAGNDGRPEEVDTDSFDEESSIGQLETHHHHSPNTNIIPTCNTSTDMSNIQTTTALKKNCRKNAFFQRHNDSNTTNNDMFYSTIKKNNRSKNTL